MTRAPGLRGRLSLHIAPSLALGLALLPACDKLPFDKETEPAAAPTTSSAAGTAAAVAERAAPAAPERAPSQAAPLAPAKIEVAVKDFQIFSPYSISRALQSVREGGEHDTARARFRYGVGVVVEATNATGEVLRDATLEGQLRVVGSAGESRCRFVADSVSYASGARFVSYAPKTTAEIAASFGAAAKSPWTDESGSSVEAPFRPGERIRLIARADDCDLATLADIGATGVDLSVVVQARKQFTDSVDYEFDDRDFEIALDGESVRIRDRQSSKLVVVALKDVAEMVQSTTEKPSGAGVPLSRVKLSRVVRAWERDAVESPRFEAKVSPAALTLQLVKLASGDFAHASGDVVVFLKDGKLAYDDMSRLGLNLLTAERKDLPDVPPEVSFASDELSGKVSDVKLLHFADDTSVAKGLRSLGVAWKLNLKGDAIDARLRAQVEAASAAMVEAERAALAADVSGDAAAQAKAKADLAAAKTASSAADAKYKSSLSSERGRLVKLVSCGDIRLATNKTVRGPINAKAASDACKALSSVNDVETTLSYTLDRYEVPIALVYSLGGALRWSPIASKPLVKLDPR
jgi:hypothetical protein